MCRWWLIVQGKLAFNRQRLLRLLPLQLGRLVYDISDGKCFLHNFFFFFLLFSLFIISAAAAQW